jgi:hypothetical protein
MEPPGGSIVSRRFFASYNEEKSKPFAVAQGDTLLQAGSELIFRHVD